MSLLLGQFRLFIKHGKTEVSYFSRLQGVFNPPPLDLSILGGPILHPKENWQYINFYANKAIFMVKSMKMLGNSSRGLILSQKHFLYRVCVLSIILYGFPLWFYNKVPLVL